MSKMNNKPPANHNESGNDAEAKKVSAENSSMLDNIKEYFGNAEDIPVTDVSAASKAADDGQVNIAEVKEGDAEINADIDAINLLQDAVEQVNKTELTLEDIEKLEAAAAGEPEGGGGSLPETITLMNRGGVDSLPRDLGVPPFPPAEQKVEPTVLSEEIKEDHPVEILNLTPKLLGGDAIVYEDDLLANRGPNESEGSDPTKESTTVPGDFKIVAPDGVDDLTVGGNFVITNGVFAPIAFATPLGNILSITSYDPATGVVQYEYTLLDNEQHPNGNGNNSIFEDFDVHLSDIDGDTADGTLSINIVDDVPHIEVSESIASLIVDESFLNVDATSSFANLFNAVPGADGATIVYNLSISSDGADSGIIDTATQSPVLLFMDGNDVVGRVGNDEVFRISINPNTAEVTLDQSRAVVHADPNDPNDAVSLSANDLIKITAVITDADGDQDSASRDIGNAFQFLDDAPTIEVHLADVPADKLEVDESDFNTNASANFDDNFNVISNFGADGPGSITKDYSLSVLSDGADSGLKDTLTGENVLLHLNGSVVEGRTAVTNELVFTVSVDSLTGIVTLDGIRSVEHPDPNNGDEAISLSAANLIKLTLDATIVDKDGDSAQSIAVLNIGQALSFKDDAPSIDVTQAPAPILVVDETNFLIDDTASFAGLFSAIFGADGPKDVNHDGVADADAITYALNVLAPNADSGLVDTVSNNAVLLTLEGGVVVGRAGMGGPIVFTISVDANTGDVTLNQSRAVVHNDPNDPDQANNPAVLSANNLVSLTATAHDGDFDTDSATRNIGQAFQFRDDGPNIDANQEPAPALIVDESNFGFNDSASFAGLFNSSFGNDGPKDADNNDIADPDAITYQLGISAANADSGLIDTLSDQHVLLTLEAGQVVGRAGMGGPIVFTISVDTNSGIVTLDQSRAVIHADPNDPNDAASLSSNDLIQIIATITDGDGDHDSASRDIGNAFTFLDDAPTIQVNLVDVSADKLEVDESDFNINASANFVDNFNVISNFGADGPGTITKSFALSILSDGADSGLDDTLTGENVLLHLNGSVVEGRTAVTNELVFTVSVDSLTGIVTLDGIRSVEHPNVNDNNEAITLASSNLIKLILDATIVDKDGDSAHSAAILNIGHALSFRDDGPSIDVTQAAAPILVVDESNFLIDDTASFAGLFQADFGADGPKDVNHDGVADADAITYALNILAPGADSGLDDTATGLNVLLTLEAGVVVGRAGLGGPIVFTISVDANSGDITLNQSRAVVHNDPNDPDQANNPAVMSAANLVSLTATAHDGDFDTDSATKQIGQAFQFRDDGPTAVDDCFDVPLPLQPKYNLTFVLDISGSMGTVLPNTGGKTRIELLKEALTGNGALLDSYQAASSALAITIVTFSSGAQTSMEFHDIAAAKAYIDALSANGTTNYQAAAAAATADVDSDDLNVNLNGYIDRLYWLSDGEPNPANTALTDPQELAWRNNLVQGNVEAFMLNIGGTNANLDENLRDLDDDQPGVVLTVAPDLSNLQQILIDTINQSEVTGNVLANDFIGADVNPAVLNIYFYLADNAAANAYLAAHPELIGASVDGNKVTIPVPNADITTPLGNILHIDANGDFKYTTNPHDDPNQSDHDEMYYTMRDGDGDRSSAELCFDIDLGVTITNLTSKLQGGDVVVNEDDLLASRGANESAGSDTSKESTTQPGDFNISAPNGVGELSVGGHDIIVNGVFTAVSFTTPLGNTLAITGYNAATGLITYEYTLNDNEQHPNANGKNTIFEDFQVHLVDSDGDSADAILSAGIIDDVPDAKDDTNGVASESNITLTGNLMDNDIQGADGATVTPFSATGTYGSIVVKADGSYTYTLNPNDADFKALAGGGMGSEVFNYTLIDADGDADTAKLTLSIKNNDDGVLITDLTPKAQGGDVSVDEDDLLASRGPNESAGSDPTKESTTQPGDFKISAPDGIANLSVGGHNVIVNDVFTATSFTTPLGNTLSITAYNSATGVVSYTYTLNDNEQHPNANGENNIFEDFQVSLTDKDGDNTTDTLSARIVDDVPDANDDTNGVASESNITLTGNLMANDIQGADGASVTPFSATGTYGSIVVKADGSYVYTLNINDADFKALGGGGVGVENFNYTLTDTDGDADTAKLTLSIKNNNDGVLITDLTPKAQGGDVSVDEDDLLASRGPNESAGSDPTKESTTQPGDFKISAPDGIANLSVGGHNVIVNDVFTAVSFATPLGNTLSITAYNSATGVVSYTYTLNDNEQHPNANGENNIFEDFQVSLTDKDGDNTTDTLSARIVDDVPDANDDTNGVASESNITLTGNLMANDIQGADGASVTPFSATGTYGSIVVKADGSYVYTLNVNDADFKALIGGGVGVENFNYTLTDTDGDADTAKLTLSIKNNDDGVLITDLTPKAQGGDATVDEDDLLASRGPNEAPGSDPTKESTTTTGDFKISAPDGVGNLSVGGHNVIVNDVFTATSFTTPLGNTLSITGYNAATGVVSYSYTLLDNENHAAPPSNVQQDQNSLFEDFNVTLTDKDGDSASDTLSINIIDDVPTAVDDCFAVPLAVQPKYNLTFVLDISGSMGTVLPNTNGKTRIELLKEALTSNGALLDSYQAASSALAITIVTFSSSAQTSMEFHDVASAKAYINSLSANGTTNYQAAAAAATADVDSDDAAPSLNGYTDRLYWLSDGEPNPTSTALSDAQELAWRNNLIQGNVEAFMLNIGGTNANLDENLRDLDDDQPGTVLTVAPDLSNLQQILVDTINQSEVQGNVLTNDIKGADGNPSVINVFFSFASNQEATAYKNAHPELVGPTVNGNVVTIPIPNADIITPLGNKLHIDANGDFVYTSTPNNIQGNSDHDVMYYTMKDNDGDKSSAELCFDIDLGVTITNLTPQAQGGDVTVNEDDLLANRGANEFAGSDTSKESTTQNGNFTISAPNGVGDLTIDGHAVITNGVFAATSFTTALGNTLSVTGYNSATGVVSYSYTLLDNENHPSGNGKNSIFENLNVHLSDVDGDSANATLSVNIVDDVPTAVADDYSIIKPALPKYNLVFTLDVSGSMGDIIANTGGKTRLQILKEALTSNGALLDSYAAASSALHITFVTFSTNAQTSQAFTDIQSAKNFINALSANGSTNYVAAMSNSQTVMNADHNNANLSSYIDKTYFISDGQPNVGIPNNSQYQAWQTVISNDTVDAIIMNISPPANQSGVDQYLTPLANPGDNPDVYHVNSDLSNLQGLLIGTINDLADINGNILANDVQGADGHLVVTQIQFSFASNAAATAYFNAHPELLGKTVNGSIVTIPVPQNSDIITPLGEKLHLESDGDFTYTINGSAQVGKTDSFTYTAVDSDGDPTSAQADLHIIAPQSLQMTLTSLAAPNAADSHDSIVNNDVAFATHDSPYAANVMANDAVADNGARVTEVSFETQNAAQYIHDNHLEALNATVDSDGKTVHIPLPKDGAEIQFTTPLGGVLAINHSGEYEYTANSNALDAVDHFKYTLQDQISGNLHQASLDVNVYQHPSSLVDLMGSDANDIMSTANHNANAILMEGGKGINDFIIDVSDAHAPETVLIKDLGINKQNILSFVGVSDNDHDGKVGFLDAVASFHQDGPNANLEVTLHNNTTVIFENVGTVPGNDMQALQQHLESITADLHVTK